MRKIFLTRYYSSDTISLTLLKYSILTLTLPRQLTRGDYAWFGHGWISTATPVWYPEWDMDLGVPIGPMVDAGEGVFTRKWSKGNVALDCTTYRAEFTLDDTL